MPQQELEHGRKVALKRHTERLALTASVIAALAIETVAAFGPFNPTDFWVSGRPKMALVDIDNDGDLDAFVGEADRGQVRFYENVGTPTSAAFLRNDNDNPLPLALVGSSNIQTRAYPSFVDIDGDGDQDAFIGDPSSSNGSVGSTESIYFFRNTGTAANPLFAAQTSPLAVTITSTASENQEYAPAFADIDGDGDQDAVIGTNRGILRTFQNTGSTASPSFSELTGSNNPFNGFSSSEGFSTPSFTDIDSDGDRDLFVGSQNGVIAYFENTRTQATPVGTASFAQRTGSNNPMSGINSSSSSTSSGVQDEYSALALGDTDGDGDIDAYVAFSSSLVRFYRNTGTANAANFGGTSEPTPQSENPLDLIPDGPLLYGVELGDLDGDGDLDMIAGTFDGKIFYYQNTGTRTAGVFSRVVGDGAFGSLEFRDPSNNLAGNWVYPTLHDLDGDGDLDLSVGTRKNTGIRYFRNDGTAQSPSFTERTGANNPFDGTGISTRASVTFGDYILANGGFGTDGLIDAVVGDGSLDGSVPASSGTIRFLANTGTASAPDFTVRTGNVAINIAGSTTPNPGGSTRTEAETVANFSLTPRLVDLDGSGALDLMVGQRYGYTIYFRNISSAVGVRFIRDESNNPLNGRDNNSYVRPAFVDIDNDGDLDAFFGTEGNNISFFRNLAAPAAPSLLATANTTNTVALSWSANISPNAPNTPTGYYIERSLDGSTGWTRIVTNNSSLAFNDTGRTPGTTYYYRATALYASTGAGGVAQLATGTPGSVASATTLPNAPTGLTATATAYQVALSWNDVSNETSFRIERAEGAGPFSALTTVDAGTTSYTDTVVLPSTSYSYRIVAVLNSIESVPSETASDTTPPAAPTNLAATPSVGQVLLSWLDNSSDETSFRIERAATIAGPFVAVDSAAANATSYIDASVTPGSSYVYRVVAVNANGESLASDTASASVPLPAVVAPSNLVAVASRGQIALSWADNSSDETSFRIERSANGSTGWVNLASVAAGTTSYTDSGLPDGTTYYYRVVALRTTEFSNPSNVANATTSFIAALPFVAAP
jgi:fibronectin type 3 domain-containing protein